MTNRIAQLAGVFGIAFVAALVITRLVAPSPPDFNAQVGSFSTYVTDHHTALARIIWIQGVAGVLFFIPFLVGLRTVVRLAEAKAGVFSNVAFAGGILAVALGLTVQVLMLLLVFRPPASDPTLTRMLWDATYLGKTFVGFPLALYVLATSIIVMRTAVLDKWLGYTGVLVTVLAIFSTLALRHHGFLGPNGWGALVGYFAVLAWTLAAAVLLVVRGNPFEKATGAPQPA